MLSIPLNKLPCLPSSSPPALVRSTYYNPPANSTLIRLLKATRLNLLLYLRFLIFFSNVKITKVLISDAYKLRSPWDNIHYPIVSIKAWIVFTEYIISLDSYWINLSYWFSSQDNSLAQKRSTQSLHRVSLLKMKTSISVSLL